MNRSSDLGRLLMIGGLGLFVAFTYFGFAPPHHHVLELLAKARDPALFPADPFLADAGAFGVSLLYPFVRLTGLPLGNDLFGLGLHLLAGGLLVAGAVAVTRRRLTGGDEHAALLTVLIGFFFSAKLLDGVQAGPLPLYTPTPAGIAHLLGIAALLAGLDRRPALAAVAASLCVACFPQGNLVIALAVPVWLAFDRSLPRGTVLWGLVPLAVAVGMADAVASRPLPGLASGASMAAQPLLAVILLVLACVLAGLAGRRETDSTLRGWAWGLAGLTLLGVAAVLCQSLVAPDFALIPVLFPAAATAVPTWFLLTWLVARILVSSRLAGLERLLLLAAVLVLAPHPAALGGVVALLLLARLLLLVREKLGWGVGTGLIPAPVLVPVLLLLLLARSGTDWNSPVWADRTALLESGRWSAGVFADPSAWAAWNALRPSPDFPLIALYENRAYQVPDRKAVALPGALELHPAANIAAGKSPFLAPPGFVSVQSSLNQEALAREAVVAELIHVLSRGDALSAEPVGLVRPGPGRPPVEVTASLETFLAERRVGVLVPPGLARLFPAALPRRMAGEHVLIGFGITP